MAKDRPVLFLIGVVLLLLGLYGSLKTIVNVVAFEQYPQESIFDFQSSSDGYAPSMQREEDCALTYSFIPPVYYESDGTTPRPATAAEIESDKAYQIQQIGNAESCVHTIHEARTAALVNDVSQSLIFLLLSFGVLLFCVVFRKPFLLKL